GEAVAEHQQCDAIVVLGQHGAHVAQTHLRDVHDIEAADAWLEETYDALDGLVTRSDHEDHPRLHVSGLPRDVEDVDDGIVDREVDQVAQLPTHCGAQLARMYVGCLDLHQLVVLNSQHTADTGARELTVADDGCEHMLRLDLDGGVDGA